MKIFDTIEKRYITAIREGVLVKCQRDQNSFYKMLFVEFEMRIKNGRFQEIKD